MALKVVAYLPRFKLSLTQAEYGVWLIQISSESDSARPAWRELGETLGFAAKSGGFCNAKRY